MGEEFKVWGTKDRLEEVSATDILCAIVKGQNINIKYCSINGPLTLAESQFELEERERGTKRGIVRPDVWIRDSVFDERIWFSNLIFEGSVAFQGTTFEGSVSLSNVLFKKGAAFHRSRFVEMAIMHIESNEDIFFDNASFEDVTSFTGSTFHRYAGFDRVSFDTDPYLSRADFLIDLARVPANDASSMFLNLGLAYRKASIYGAGEFFARAGKGYAWKYFNERKRQKYGKTGTQFIMAGFAKSAVACFRKAKLEYNKDGEYDKVGEMHIKEYDFIRLHLKARKAQKKSQKGDLGRLVWLCLWNYTSSYGESPRRFLKVAAGIVFIFALICIPIIGKYLPWWLSITYGNPYPFKAWDSFHNCIFNFITGLYYSAVTFATLGFGDIAPVSIMGKVCAIVEVFLGYFMFGVLITMVSRKMIRN